MFNFDEIKIKNNIFHLVLISACKQLQENQAVPADLKNQGKKDPPKQESLVFLKTTMQRVGEKAENQQKN
jgi:hypothetical protein